MSTPLKLAFGSVIVGILVLVLKGIAFWITGSVALYSDALESTVNVVTALAALLAVRLAAQPADANHPYGHHKAEYVSAVLEGVMIGIAAIMIAAEAYQVLLRPRPIDAPATGLAINAAATVINAGWSAVLIRQGRRLRSPALVADGKHLLTDVVSSVGVAVGLVLAIATGWHVLDPILALVVAANILWSGYQVVKDSLGGLMDEAPAPDVLDRIRGVISAEAQGAIEAHDLRTRVAASVTFVEFHLVVPGQMTVTDAHEICDRIEQAVKAAVAGALVTIHVEPEEKAKHTGIVVL